MSGKNLFLVDRLKRVESQAVSSTRFGNVPLFWNKAEGCCVYDVDGREYLDCTSSYGVMGIGYAHPKVVESIKIQTEKITHTMCEIYPHEKYLEALEKIQNAIGRKDNQVLLTTSGSDAVEVALKLAYRYTGKEGVIAFQGAFHGQTLGTLAVTGHNCFRTPFTPLVSKNTVFVPYPNIYRDESGIENLVLEKCISQIEDIINSEKPGAVPIGAIIVEPMQNAGGYIVPPKGFLTKLRTLCDQYSILLITDEIFTGFGRCGKWLMADYEDVKADIVCVGKTMTSGFPAAACVASKEIMCALDYCGMVPLHGSTYIGNGIACAVISTTIDILTSENLVNESYKKGNYLRNELKKILSECPYVGEVRGLGSATMIEFVENQITKKRNPEEAVKFANYLLSNGIIVLVSGLPYGNCVAFCTPFIIQSKEIEFILEVCKMYVKSI